MNSIRDKISLILIQKIGLHQSEITPGASFIKDLGVDSLDYVEIIMQFEHTFQIKIPDEDAKNLETVSQAEEYIRSKIAQKEQHH